MAQRSIFLIGPMGAGKTTSGKELARTLGMDFVDADHEIERRTGARISLIFELEGEAGFRIREKTVIDALTQRHNLVLATGGGAILDAENRNHLAGRGMVIYLRASIDQLYQRTSKDHYRPLLQTMDPKAKLEELMKTRTPLYEQIADLTIDTDGQTIKWIVKKVLEHIHA